MPVAFGPGKRVVVSDGVGLYLGPASVIENGTVINLKKCRKQEAHPAPANDPLPEMFAVWQEADLPLGSAMIPPPPVQSLKQLL